MKNLLSSRCRRFMCPVMAVIITCSPLVSFGAWSILQQPMSVTQMEKVKTNGDATGAGQTRDVKFGTISLGNFNTQGTSNNVQSINSGMPMMPMYTWKTEIPPLVRWSLSPGMPPMPDHYIRIDGPFANSPPDAVSTTPIVVLP